MQFQSSQKTKGMELLPLSAALPPSLIAGGNSAAASLLLIAARISPLAASDVCHTGNRDQTEGTSFVSAGNNTGCTCSAGKKTYAGFLSFFFYLSQLLLIQVQVL